MELNETEREIVARERNRQYWNGEMPDDERALYAEEEIARHSRCLEHRAIESRSHRKEG